MINNKDMHSMNNVLIQLYKRMKLIVETKSLELLNQKKRKMQTL